jgi:hypothetical protein
MATFVYRTPNDHFPALGGVWGLRVWPGSSGCHHEMDVDRAAVSALGIAGKYRDPDDGVRQAT